MSGAFTSQATSAPWDVQVPYLKEAFSGGKQLYEQGTPESYRGPSVAGFDPIRLRHRKEYATTPMVGLLLHYRQPLPPVI